MRLKTYQAFTVEEALVAVKRDLGPDAVILGTRTIRRRGLLGFGGDTVVQVTASENPTPPAPTPARSPALSAYLATGREPSPRTAPAAGAASAPARGADPRESVPSAPAPDRELRSLRDVVRAAVREERVAAGLGVPSGTSEAGPQSTPEARHDPPRAIPLEAKRPPTATAAAAPAAEPREPQLEEHYRLLIERDVSAALAGAIIERVRRALPPADLARPERVRGAVLDLLEALIPVDGGALPRRGPDGRPLTLALVGTTGVGKTTSIAKLAAGLRIRRGAEVGVIAADTSKRGAVEELRAYCEAIGARFEVGGSVRRIQAAVARLAECEAILIDTPGRSPVDQPRLRELGELLRAADPHEIHLVIPATAGERSLIQAAEAFRSTGYSRVILTKLDETAAFGVIAGALRRIGTSLSFVSTGQAIPDHLERGHARRLAEWLLDGVRGQ